MQKSSTPLKRIKTEPASGTPSNKRSQPNHIDIQAPYPKFDSQHALSFYDTPPPPNAELSIDKIESWALDRMTVLDELDGYLNKPRSELAILMRGPLRNYLSVNTATNGKTTTELTRLKDRMSHFILRLCFCTKEDKRARFIKLETELFRIRFENGHLIDNNNFVSSLNLEWQVVDGEELASMEQLLRFANPNQSTPLETHFKIPMEDATELIRSRKVVVRGGTAYVPKSMLVAVLAREFSKRLKKNMEYLAKFRLRFQKEPRMQPVLELASSGFAKLDGPIAPLDTNAMNLKANMMSSLDKENYLPFCASMLQDSLVKKRHPKHKERLQHQRFLVNIGMPVKEAIDMYTKYYDDSKKLSGVINSVRHSYGLTGQKKLLAPGRCDAIYSEGKGANPNESHGCPFQRLESDKLAMMLRNHGVTDQDGIDTVLRHSKEGQIHLACTKTYELTHPDDKTIYNYSISSPVQYFQRAVEFKKLEKK